MFRPKLVIIRCYNYYWVKKLLSSVIAYVVNI
jgi:hypothetical protein